MSEQKNNLGVKILLGSAAFVVSTWVSAYLSINSASAQWTGIDTTATGGAFWGQNAVTKDLFYTEGKVGIGTQSPTSALEVSGDVKISGTLDVNQPVTIHNGWRGLKFMGANDAPHEYQFVIGCVGGGATCIDGTAGNNTREGGFGLWDETAQKYRFVINKDGNAGIGTIDPLANASLHVARPSHLNVIFDRTDTSDHLTAVIGSGGSGFRFSDSNFFFVGAEPYANRDSTGAGTEFFRITNTGSVGIGTTTPVSKLDVNGQIAGGFGAMTTAGTLDWNHISNARSGNGYTLLKGGASHGPGPDVYFHPFNFEYSNKDGTGNMTQFAIPYAVSGTGSMYMRSRYSGTWTSWSKIISEDSSGKVGIGMAAHEKFHVNGSIAATGYIGAGCEAGCETGGGYAIMYGNGTIVSSNSITSYGSISALLKVYAGGIALTSDQSLKKDIEPLKNALDKILKLQGATYHWKDEKKDPNLQIGFIAQEVEKVLPELVNTSEKDGLKNLNYIGIIPLLTEAVKEQQKQIEDLKNQLNILKDAQK